MNMTTDDLLIQYLSEGVKRADRAVNRAAVFAVFVALFAVIWL